MKKALFPGTFDPFHDGHYEILIRAQKLFKKIIIFIGNNDAKKSSDFLTRYKQIKAFLASKKNKVKIVYGLDKTVDIAKKHHCNYIIRGIRDIDDFEYELNFFYINKNLNHKIEIIYFMAENKFKEIRSNKIKNELF